MKWRSLCAAAVLLLPVGALSGCSGLGGKPQPPPDYKPVMPPGGNYGGAASNPMAGRLMGGSGNAPAPSGR
jgi:hypothetical protein